MWPKNERQTVFVILFSTLNGVEIKQYNPWSNCIFLLWQVRELEPLLCQIDHNSLVIWTSSSNAQRSAFSLDDIQHQKGREPYSSSKYASDLLSLALNRHYNNRVSSQFPKENGLLHDMFYTVIIYDYHNCDLVMNTSDLFTGFVLISDLSWSGHD